MKRVVRSVMMVVLSYCTVLSTTAQTKIDEGRMERDIEIAENVLGTLIKQKMEQKRMLFPMNVEGNYMPGFGITLRIPNQLFGASAWSPGADIEEIRGLDGGGFSYSFSFSEPDEEMQQARNEKERAAVAKRRVEENVSGERTLKTKRRINSDSARQEYDKKLIAAAKDFLSDYGDMISQLPNDEKIVITNRNASGQRMWVGTFLDAGKQSYLAVEATRSDIASLKQGKITRDQFQNKIRVVNSELEDELYPDRELLSSIFNRLYRTDLSKTFYTNESIYYEGLKDFGVIYYMKVYSSNQREDDRYSMPTLKLDEVDQATRDKKVKELYPQFDKSMKEDMLEYGRTLKSLKNEESLIFNVTLTRCAGCEIPSFVEYSVKASVLNDYSSGKLSKDAAMAKIATKKGPNQ